MNDKKFKIILMTISIIISFICGAFLLTTPFLLDWDPGWGSLSVIGGVTLVVVSLTALFMFLDMKNIMTDEEIAEYEKERKKPAYQCNSCGIKKHPNVLLKKYELSSNLFTILVTLCRSCRMNYQKGGYLLEVLE